jgi:hypothetical protein
VKSFNILLILCFLSRKKKRFFCIDNLLEITTLLNKEVQMKELIVVVFLLLFSLILPAQKMLLPVPYHGQGDVLSGYPPLPNNWCTVACLHMLFDYYDHMDDNPVPPVPLQIASVCNTDDVAGTGSAHAGTFASDARRAAHFSKISASADGAVVGGYSWRGIGYSVIDSTNGQAFLMPGTNGMVGWMEVLNEGYPVIFNGGFPWELGPPEGGENPILPPYTALGHSILLVGYDLGNKLLYFHDPWYGPYVSYSIDTLGIGWFGNYIFASPWEVKINAPDTVIQDTSFFVAASVRYSAPTLEYVQPNGVAFGQEFPVVDYPIAVLEVDSCSIPLVINNPVDTLYLIDRTQSSYACYWSVTPVTSGIFGSFRVKAEALLLPASSNSYPVYQDTIGGIVTGDCAYVKDAGGAIGFREFDNYRTSLFPNPFVQSNSVTLSLPKEGKVKISIFDELGREVKVLTDGSLGRGQHTIPWDGTGREGNPMPAGKYFYSISVDGRKLPGEKAVLLK